MANANSQPTTFLERDNWMRAVNASGEPRAARCLAFAIALHLNVKTGRCNPGHETLSTDAGISMRSTERFVALLERDGWLAIKRGGGGNYNSYVLRRPASDLADQEHTRAASNLADQNKPDPPVSAHQIRQLGQSDPPLLADRKAKRKAKREKKKEDIDAALDFASPDSGKDASEPKASGHDGDNITVADTDLGFEEFWVNCPKKVAKEKARKAHAAAIKRGADPAKIIAAIKRYAIERAGQDPTFTKHPTTWLDDGCYDDEASSAGGTMIDQDGNVIDTPQRSRPKTLEEIEADILADYVDPGKSWERRR
jgi:hypothetical protein